MMISRRADGIERKDMKSDQTEVDKIQEGHYHGHYVVSKANGRVIGQYIEHTPNGQIAVAIPGIALAAWYIDHSHVMLVDPVSAKCRNLWFATRDIMGHIKKASLGWEAIVITAVVCGAFAGAFYAVAQGVSSFF